MVVILGLIVWLNREERRYVSPLIGNFLLLLRCLVVLLIMLMLWEPVVQWSISQQNQKQVLIGVDFSGSMTTIDDHAMPDEKLRWAHAAGMIGNAKTTPMLKEWIEAYENGKQPEWISPEESMDAESRKILADSRKEMTEKIFKQLNERSRLNLVMSSLLNPVNSFMEKLNQKGNVTLLGFAEHKQEIAKEQYESPQFVDELNQLSQKMGASKSDLSLVLNHQPENNTGAVSAIVLFSDGRDSSLAGNESNDKIMESVRRLKQLNIPVYTILSGSQKRPLDLSIAALDYPTTVYKGDRPLLKAMLNTSGFESQTIQVQLKDQMGKVVEQKDLLVTGPSTEIELPLKSDELGRHQYEMEIVSKPEEIHSDNNTHEFFLNISDDTSHVMLIDGEGRWEFRFIESALSRDNRVSLKSILFRQPYLGILSQPFFERQLAPTTPAKKDAPQISPFEDQHLVILGDISPTHFTSQDWKNLEKFVSEGGGTLVISAGKRFMPLMHESPILQKLLPVQEFKPLNLTGSLGRKSPLERGFHLNLTGDGQALSMLQFDSEPQKNKEIWDQLPGETWGMTASPKPGSTILANLTVPKGSEALVLPNHEAMIVQQSYGFGQVFWIGIDSTWRWRHRVGDQFHHRFWGQLCRYAADNKATAGNQFVRFGPDRPDITSGDDVVVHARWTSEFMRNHPHVKSRVEIYKKSESLKMQESPLSMVEMHSLDTTPLVQEARLTGLPEGQYLLRLKSDSNLPDQQMLEAELTVNAPKTAEMNDVSTNKSLLQQISEVSGGKTFRLDELNKLEELLRPDEDVVTKEHERSLWDHWTVMVTLFSILSLEWATRKLNGLA